MSEKYCTSTNSVINKHVLINGVYNDFLLKLITQKNFSKRYIKRFMNNNIETTHSQKGKSYERKSITPYTKWNIKRHFSKYALEDDETKLKRLKARQEKLKLKILINLEKEKKKMLLKKEQYDKIANKKVKKALIKKPKQGNVLKVNIRTKNYVNVISNQNINKINHSIDKTQKNMHQKVHVN
jgi:hypothetical protein